jgi:hypothetical protein
MKPQLRYFLTAKAHYFPVYDEKWSGGEVEVKDMLRRDDHAEVSGGGGGFDKVEKDGGPTSAGENF